ncbi:phage major capsid protein [Clostridium perfringens]|uniref:phage major capsid protein n=1 Tax=Clostridium perfringens TaxID=1502 RepID=UPI00232AE738|nr:phage major capsid protein [Clostridium perfringens]MDB2049595.1 phage major capsid protein [Clostridium perfringens]
MTKEQIQAKMKELMAEAQNCIAEGKGAEAQAKADEIQNLKNDMNDLIQAEANLNALNNIVNVVPTNSVPPTTTTAPVNVLNTIDPLDMNPIENVVAGQLTKEQEDLYVNAWAKDMLNKPLTDAENSIFDAQNSFTHTTENTGILIPETVAAGIWKEVENQYPLWADVFKTGIKGNIKVLMSESSTDAKWYDEATGTEDGTEKFAEVMLTGCELARSVTVSWKLREMSIKEFIPFIQSQLAERIGAALGYAVAVGKGKPGESQQHKPEPRGIITALKAESETPRIIEYSKETPLAYEMCTKAMSLIKSAYKQGAYIYADNTTIWNELANMVDKMGRPYFVPDPTSGGVGRILGLTVKEDDSLGEGNILFGNANKGYHANINKQIMLDSEDRKKKRETDYLAYGIVDGDVRTLNAFALITKKAVSGRKGKAGKDKEQEQE